MMSDLCRIDVNLGPRSYPVLIGTGLLRGLGGMLRSEGLKQTGAFVVTNPQVGGHYYETIRVSLAESGIGRVVRHDIPLGEEGKNWEEFGRTCGAVLENFPDAGSVPLVLLLGGGVVGDLGGFAAAVFRRGVPFVQIPTSLLAAVDSSVGGKVAVNFGGVKNIMGAFSQPRLVVCDLAALPSASCRSAAPHWWYLVPQQYISAGLGPRHAGSVAGTASGQRVDRAGHRPHPGTGHEEPEVSTSV